MPKMKSHRGAAKRFSKTGTGKITRRKANLRHILTKKSSDRKRKLGQTVLASKADTRRIKQLVPTL